MGKVVDQNNIPLEGVAVTIPNLKKGAYTDVNGRYQLTVKQGRYTVVAKLIGFKQSQKEVTVNNNKITAVSFTLAEDVGQLENVMIVAKNTSQKIKEEPYAVESLKMKGLKNLSTNANEVLGQLSGVSIRKTGGLGSSFTFSMNGMSGKQVKFFMDDIPIDNLGSSLSLDNFPTNLIDRIDVFKGVVPVYLGSDALGGAVNVVTNERKSTYLDASYSFGSFNTHIFSLLGRFFDEESGIVGKILTFQNYSGNSYKIDNVNVTDDLGNVIDAIDDVKRFHDAYHSAMINIQVGLAKKPFADDLLVGAMFSKNTNELQHSLDYQKPFGEVHTKEHLKQTSITYRKRDILKNVDGKLYGSLSKKVSRFIDTSSYIYSWTKQKRSNTSPSDGEFGRKSLAILNDRMHFANASLKYSFSENRNHQLNLNFANSFLERTGDNDIPRGYIPFKEPHSVDKNVLGISYDFKLFEKKWNSSVFSKFYDLAIKGRILNSLKNTICIIDNQFNEFGYGFASTYKFNPQTRLKVSFERALRLPEGTEVFGDGALTEPNVGLLPEKSYNVNVGGMYQKALSSKLNLFFDVNCFYRKSENLIVLTPKIITSIYTNAYDAKSVGVEGTLNLKFGEHWVFKSNITKQHITEVLDGKETKIPNIPLSFGNISLGYHTNTLLKPNDKLSFLLSTRYVEGYPVYSFTSGDANRPTVDDQLSQNFNINYSINNYNISFSVNNLWDATLFDNFKLQQPRRAFYVKMRYSI